MCLFTYPWSNQLIQNLEPEDLNFEDENVYFFNALWDCGSHEMPGGKFGLKNLGGPFFQALDCSRVHVLWI